MHPNIGSSYLKLVENFNQDFGDIKIDYNLFPEEQKKDLIYNFKKRNNHCINKNINIIDVLNIKNFAISSINNKKYKNSLGKNFNENLTNFEIKNQNIVTRLIVSYTRKKIEYKKEIFCIMAEEMEANLINNNKIQYFADVTYYCVPPNNKHYRLFVLMSSIKLNIKPHYVIYS